MRKLNWDEIRDLAGNATTLFTKTRKPFQITVVSESVITVRVSTGQEHTISRKNLEAALAKLQAGVVLDGPQDYLEHVADERPAYAWAILKHLGLLN